jgi:hypothetical protein
MLVRVVSCAHSGTSWKGTPLLKVRLRVLAFAKFGSFYFLALLLVRWLFVQMPALPLIGGSLNGSPVHWAASLLAALLVVMMAWTVRGLLLLALGRNVQDHEDVNINWFEQRIFS